MNSKFRDKYSKLKCFHSFALIAKFRNKYCTSSISYELRNVEDITYNSFKKFTK